LIRAVKVGPDKDSFGCNFLKSFLDHVECYQSIQEILHNHQRVGFVFTDDPTMVIYDFFELDQPHDYQFTDTTILVIETLRQVKKLVNDGRLDLAKKYIILSESWWDTEKYKFDFEYEMIYVSWDIIDSQNRLTNRSDLYHHLMDLSMLGSYNPTYDFLCLIGRGKEWRDTFVKKLQTIDLTNTLTSYYGKCIGNQDLLDLDIEYSRANSVEEFEQKFYKNVQLASCNHSYNLSYFTKMDLFKKTNFSLIVETEAELEEYHVTEKTLKCLILGHPFIVMGTPKFLKFLHSMGFKTCSSIFDESYDNIMELESRMDAVIDLVKKVRHYDFNTYELEKIQTHNITTLAKLRNTDTYTNFLNAII
jgi:hypothetical protein